MRQLGAVDLLQVVQDVPHGHAVRVQADAHVIQATGHPPGPLGTSSGSNVPARSRGTARPTGPTPVCTVLAMVPLR